MIINPQFPFSNQFERGKSFNWAEKWTIGKHYYNNEYIVDFVSFDNCVLACRKSHVATEQLRPKIIIRAGKVVDVDSPYWSLVVGQVSNQLIADSKFIKSATEEDAKNDPDIIIGNSYLQIIYESGIYVYIPLDGLSINAESIGIPVMTQKMLDESEEEPSDYLLIPDKADLDTNTTGSSYVDILFSAIRKLQAEVSRLKNSFKYGITSYMGTDTATSEIVSEYSNIEEDEPLWSIEEEDLSEIPEATIDLESNSLPFIGNNIIYDGNGCVTFENASIDESVVTAYRDIEDTKMFLYLTTSKPAITIQLSDCDTNKKFININIDELVANTSERYNICILISRKVIEDDLERGKNYIWLSIGHFTTNKTIIEGYYNPNTHEISKNLATINDRYFINNVQFTNLTLYKYNSYSKYQDFSHEIIQSKPSDDTYKYRVAHITIRSVANSDELKEVQSRLLSPELVWQEDSRLLWINDKNGLTTISGSSIKPSGGMTEQEMIEKLEGLGIIYVDGEGLQLSDVSDVTFINNNTGKKFKFSVNASGDLDSTEIPKETLADIIKELKGTTYPLNDTEDQIRGFVAKINASRSGIDPIATKDIGLNADRIKIGAVYAPKFGDTKFGCTHGYIELENTSDKDFPLDGCYLHYLHWDEENSLTVCSHLALSGIIPVGSTYLIRCKQYAEAANNADAQIIVDTYDIEWYENGNLIDLTMRDNKCSAFALTYGNTVAGKEVTENTEFYKKNTDSATLSKATCVYPYNFIDSLVFGTHPPVQGAWGTNFVSVNSNTIVKNTFELDPAKQAYQGLTTYDSSRQRLDNVKNDIQYLNLDNEYISFPNSDDVYPISKFTPKSSKCKKNVSTDKSKLDMAKPNMVTCAFGIDIYKTRTFNWISAGEFDEYVFIKDGDGWIKFESYKSGDSVDVTQGNFTRKGFDPQIINVVYKRITGNFPGDGSRYTSHKCIIGIDKEITSPTIFTYIVGRANTNGGPDFNHCSDEQTFTLYPTSYIPRIYQISDQQGFHWIEYQVWTAAANTLNNKIIDDCSKENIIPVLINTGDMTQNGTRINEWLDYYNAGKCLFTHLEQMNVVGNNDLCGTDVTVLGTGDDIGKSNGFYFHVFYCYEINPENSPIINDKYIPSLYYFDSEEYRFVMVNSELTEENCKNWFNLKDAAGNAINAYTGWSIGGTDTYSGKFTSVYTMLYKMLNSKGDKEVIAACHEMPFTVITKACLNEGKKGESRSLNGTSLVGSHLNHIGPKDVKARYWFSRLLEYFGVKLCIGGHKHTYACTHPVRENYYYQSSGEWVNSMESLMPMQETLQLDTAVWTLPGDYSGEFSYQNVDTSKKPYIKKATQDEASTGQISPAISIPGLSNGVVYFMCQATGYKLTSNKELPGNGQHFSCLIPETATKSDGSDSPDGAQQRPMFAVISLGENYTIKLCRIENIKTKSGFAFTQSDYSTERPVIEYATHKDGSRYCNWNTEETVIVTV